ncbi:MAG: hypothetical protein K0S65_965 [Labilithrix sp.]|nr:hypothetical protein [Labilithrix sp.]
MKSSTPRAFRQAALMTLSIVASLQMLGCAPSTQSTQAKEPSPIMNNKPSNSADVVNEFFAAFGKGNMDGIIATFHPQAEIVAVRKAARKHGDIYGSYSGKDGAKAFVASLGGAFDTQAFSVDHVVGQGNVVFASGSFTHKLKTTGKPFSSDWALKCIVEDGKIREYHFFEDSAAYVEASRAAIVSADRTAASIPEP